MLRHEQETSLEHPAWTLKKEDLLALKTQILGAAKILNDFSRVVVPVIESWWYWNIN